MPHSDQGKIPCVFNIFHVLFWPQNITFILLPLPTERYTSTNTHSKPQSQMQQSLWQKTSLHHWVVPQLKIYFKAKRLQMYPTTILIYPSIFKTSKFSQCWREIPLHKNILLIFISKFQCFPCLEKWASKFTVFPVPWQPRKWLFSISYLLLLLQHELLNSSL